jgi:S-DNA-T family DNA segregation ATPase FtsK/SpoIIIE
VTGAIRRPPRQPGPALPTGELSLEPPPELTEQVAGSGGGMGQSMMYLPMMIGPALFSVAYQPDQPMSYVVGGVYGLAAVGMIGGQLGRAGRDRQRKVDAERRDYLRYLAQVRRKVRRAAREQREALLWGHPEPDALWTVALGQRLWERRPTDEDFAQVRVAVGRQRLAVRLAPPDTKPVEDLEPLTAGALRRLVRVHSSQPDLPVAVALRGFGRVVVAGDGPAGRALVRALLAQLVTFHAPEHLRVLVCASADRLADWDWVKWLPHARDPDGATGPGAGSLVGTEVAELERLVAAELADRPWFDRGAPPLPDRAHVIAILDGADEPADSELATGLHGVTVVEIRPTPPAPAGDSATRPGAAGPPDLGPLPPDAAPRNAAGHSLAGTDSIPRDVLRLTVQPGQVAMRRGGGDNGATTVGRPDALTVPEAEALARLLAPVRIGAAGEAAAEPLASDVSLPALLGIGDPDGLDPAVAWRTRSARSRLRVPIAVTEDGTHVELDLKESAEDGMGPHGLLIGATGSGKSELLRTLVLGLAMTHSPEALNFALVDFKGGATFLGMESLPHVSAVITNLVEELPLVDRMHDALHGELVRRQELLRAAGNVASRRDYDRLRAARPDLPPLPALLVVVDEFSELLTGRPEFAELFVMIGRLGRSLGVHLLLASQRLDEGRLRGLETHLSYRIGLRTFSSMESRTVLGVPDAYELPPSPGNGYLKVGTNNLVRFKAAYVSGRHGGTDDGPAPVPRSGPGRQVLPFKAGYLEPTDTVPEPSTVAGPAAGPGPEQVAEQAEPEQGARLLDVIVRRLAGHGRPAHQIWLPPLGAPTTLAQLLGPPVRLPDRGLTVADRAAWGTLRVPAGIVDKPFEQRHDLLWADLSGAGGHAAVVGRPRSGKSTLLRTILASLALTHTPAEVQLYCVDLGGGALSGLAELPHVGRVAGRLEPDVVRRTVAELAALLERRERDFAARRIDSIADYRRLRRDGRVPGDGYGDAFLVVDGWQTFRQEFEALEPAVLDLAARGLAYGVHVVVAANRWSEIRPGLRDLLGTRFELRLGEPFESEVHRRAAANVPEHAAGRGITKEGLHFLGALPRVDAAASVTDLADGVRRMVRVIAAEWAGAPAPPVRLLPAELPAAALPAPDPAGRHVVPIGIDENALAPVQLDFTQEPHLLIVGDTESGKSNLLRLIAGQLADRHTPKQARLVMIDYRRALLDAVTSDHLIAYAATRPAAETLVRDVAEALRDRLPGPDVTAEQLRTRTWWQGADLYVLVDDHDLVAGTGGGSTSPLLPLLDLIPQARDVGLHLVLAQRSGGISRSLFEPVLRAMRDATTAGLLLSGSRDEGVVLGDVRMQKLPPGRGILVGRRLGNRMVQTALADQAVAPAEPEAAAAAPRGDTGG